MKRNAFRKGVTLVEVLVASLILVITITGVLMSIVYSLRIVQNNAIRFSAQSIVRSKFDQLNNCTSLSAVNAMITAAPTTYTDASGFTDATYTISYATSPVEVNDFTTAYTGTKIPKLLSVTATVTSTGETFTCNSYVLNSFK